MPAVQSRFNPNSLGRCGNPDPVRQAEILDKILAVIRGGESFEESGAKALRIGGDGAYLGGTVPIEAGSFAESQQKFPSGTWAVAVSAPFRRGESDSGVGETVAYLRATGQLPCGVAKIAVFPYSDETWASAIKFFLESGIYLIMDPRELFCFASYNPARVGGDDGYSEEVIELQLDGERGIGADTLDAAAVGYAMRTVAGHRAPCSLLRIPWELLNAISLGGYPGDAGAEQIMQECQNRNGRGNEVLLLPPEGYPARNSLGKLLGLDALLMGWNGYLERFGVAVDVNSVGGEAYGNLSCCLEALSCPGMEEKVSEALEGLGGRADMLRVAHEMAVAGPYPDDFAGMGCCSRDKSAKWPSFGGPPRGLSTRVVHLRGKCNQQKEAIARADAKLRYGESMSNGCRLDPSQAAHPYYRGLFWQKAELDWSGDGECPDTVEDLRWGGVLIPPVATDPLRYRTDEFVKCFLASGLADGYDIIVEFSWKRDIPEDMVRSVVEELESGGIGIAAARDGFLGYPAIPISMEKAVLGGRRPPDPVIPKRGDVSPGLLDLLEPAIPSVIAGTRLGGFHRGKSSPNVLAGLLPMLSGGRLSSDALPVMSPPEGFPMEFLSVLSPLEEFFDIDTAEIDLIVKTLRLWGKVLFLNGLSFSRGFPLGVSRSCFAKLSDVLGMEAYLSALYDGIEIDDLIPLPEGRGDFFS